MASAQILKLKYMIEKMMSSTEAQRSLVLSSSVMLALLSRLFLSALRKDILIPEDIYFLNKLTKNIVFLDNLLLKLKRGPCLVSFGIE